MRKFVLTPLSEEARTGLPTDEAAAHLNRDEQTLRRWACKGDGPIQPRRVGARLLWPTAKLRELLEA